MFGIQEERYTKKMYHLVVYSSEETVFVHQVGTHNVVDLKRLIVSK